ncbi:lytic transglycosylase domain-containing protein [Novosphingobium sp. HK4-1]|nr:lytic transglycosylase domain-containing protein [Novosphingobium mangrovi (ex Huang et al. 2023)]
MFLATPVHAAVRKSDEARIASCIHGAAAGRPWLEKTLWGLRDQEAGWIGAEVGNTNGTHDLGPLQINTRWVSRIAALVGRPAPEVRHWLRFDPCFNVEAARWIFLAALKDTGDFWKAVGIYHSPTAWRQRRYSLSVAKRMHQRFGKDVYSDP